MKRHPILALTISLTIAMTSSGCDNAAPEPKSAAQLFETRLQEHGIDFERNEIGLYAVQIGENNLKVNLENVARTYERDGDPEAVRRFADRLLTDYATPTPDWEDVKPYVLFCLEPDDYEEGFDGILHDRVDDELVRVFVYTPEDGSLITWISDSNLEKWGVSADELTALAEEHMENMASKAKIEVKEIDGVRLGMIATEEHPFKASLLLAGNFRELVEPTLGFPVYAVAPCRDFVYLVPHENKDFLGRLGKVVVQQFNESGYSITMDILEVTENGVAAIATFGPPTTEAEGNAEP